MSDICPHCNHPWDEHVGGCHICGCLWTNPADIPPPPEPLSSRDLLIANIEDTIWAALESQAEGERFGPCVDRDDGLVDGSDIDMTAVAAAVAAIFVDRIDDCSWCHSPTAVDGWKQPIDADQIGDAVGGWDE